MSKIALITGCDSAIGIGQALCRELVQRGFRVYATGLDLTNMESLRASAPESVTTMVMDVTSEDEVNRVVAEVVRQAGRIDLVVNNAGIAGGGPVVETDLGFARRMFDINFWGTWAVCKAVGNVMARQRSGTIVNIGSIAGRAHAPFGAAYCSSKGAVESITHSLRMEMKPFGVRVVYVAPAWCATNLTRSAGTSGLGSREVWERGLYGGLAYDTFLNEVRAPERPSAWPPQRIAKRIVDAAVARRPPMTVYGGAQHLFLRFVLSFLPRFVVDIIFSYIYGLRRPLLPGLAAPAPGGKVAGSAAEGPVAGGTKAHAS